MPTIDWQLIVALAAVAGAAAYFVRRALKTWAAPRRGAGACGTCGSCPAGQSPGAGPPSTFVALDPVARRSAGD